MSREQTSLMTPGEFLGQVRHLLDGKEWDASTIETVVSLARLAGAEIRDPADIDTRSVEWQAGYDHGKAQCDHHPEAMTKNAVIASIDKAWWSGWDSRGHNGVLKSDTEKLRVQVDHLKRFIEEAQEGVLVVSDVLSTIEKF